MSAYRNYLLKSNLLDGDSFTNKESRIQKATDDLKDAEYNAYLLELLHAGKLKQSEYNKLHIAA